MKQIHYWIIVSCLGILSILGCDEEGKNIGEMGCVGWVIDIELNNQGDIDAIVEYLKSSSKYDCSSENDGEYKYIECNFDYYDSDKKCEEDARSLEKELLNQEYNVDAVCLCSSQG